MMRFKLLFRLLGGLILTISAGQVRSSEEQADRSEHDLGSFPANIPKAHVFTITNRSEQKLVFGKVRTSCTCSKATLSVPELSPGQAAELIIHLDPNYYSGPFVQTYYVETNLPGQRFLRFTLKGTAVPLLQIDPKPLLYTGELEQGKTYEYRFKITPTVPKVKLKLTSPEFAGLTTELKEKKDHFELQIQLNPAKPLQSFNLTFLLEPVSHPDWPAAKIVLSGQVKSFGQ